MRAGQRSFTNMDTETIKLLAGDAGLGEIAARLPALALPALRLEPARPARSRIGGLPELAPGTEWPRAADTHEFAGMPMTFICQLELSAIAPTGVWPAQPDGLLSFFCACEGGDSICIDDPGSGKVLYTPERAGVEPMEPPADLDPESMLRELPVTARRELTLPAVASGLLEPLGIDHNLWYTSRDPEKARRAKRYGEVLLARFEQDQDVHEPRHRVLGHPAPVQGDVLEHAAMLGFETREHRSPEPEQIEAEAPSWRLLLQIDHDERLGVLWGDYGTLYYCLPEDDLKAGRYNRVETLIQTT